MFVVLLQIVWDILNIMFTVYVCKLIIGNCKQIAYWNQIWYVQNTREKTIGIVTRHVLSTTVAVMPAFSMLCKKNVSIVVPEPVVQSIWDCIKAVKIL